MTRIPRTLLQAALCIVAVDLNYSTARNLSREKLARVLRNKLPGHEDLAYEILEELVRRGYLTKHGGRRTYMLTHYGRTKALSMCKDDS